ncbi:MAG: hypothetical protein AABM33_18365 [Pseudomonadota bacterium]
MKKPSSFWHDSLHSLHPSVRIRYIPYFAMAETMDKSFDAALALWRSANEGALQAWRALMR